MNYCKDRKCWMLALGVHMPHPSTYKHRTKIPVVRKERAYERLTPQDIRNLCAKIAEYTEGKKLEYGRLTKMYKEFAAKGYLPKSEGPNYLTYKSFTGYVNLCMGKAAA